MWHKRANIRRKSSKGVCAVGGNGRVFAATEHMETRVRVPTEWARGGVGVAIRRGEVALGAMNVPVVRQFGKASAEGVRGFDCVMPEAGA